MLDESGASAAETTLGLLRRLRRLGIVVNMSTEGLRYRGPAGKLYASDIAHLQRGRDEIGLFLTATGHARTPPFPKDCVLTRPSRTQEMWWRWIGGDTSLTISMTETVQGHDIQAVSNAIMTLVKGHAILRTCYFLNNGRLSLSCNPFETFEIEYEDARDETFGWISANARVKAFTASEISGTSPWLLRARIITYSQNTRVVSLAINHLVADGASLRILRRQFQDALAGEISADDIIASPGYADFVDWQDTWHSATQNSFGAYWKLRAQTKTDLLAIGGARAMRWMPGSKSRRAFTISSSVHSRVQAMAAQSKCTLFICYMALYTTALAQWTGQPRFCLRCIADNRILPEMSDIVGLITAADMLDVIVPEKRDLPALMERLTDEYYAAARLRPTAIYAFPPYFDSRDEAAPDQADNIGVILNYQSFPSPGGIAATNAAWPPTIEVSRTAKWRHHVSPVCLELTNFGTFATASFLLHDDQLSDAQQEELVTVFCSLLQHETAQIEVPK
jgi:hypothetical protein